MEVDELAWLPIGEARERLSYEGDVELLDALEAMAVPTSSTVLLVRHGSAGDPDRWEGDDRLRPLDEKGRRQAEALGRALVAFAPTRLLSADCARCLGTLAPLAVNLGLQVEPEPRVSEAGYAQSPETGVRKVNELVSAGGTTAVCSQGTVIPHLVAAISGDVGAGASKLEAKKGSVWALFFTAGSLVAADYYPTLLGWPGPGMYQRGLHARGPRS
jgi:8-oxo-dGTP diphosphatase